MRSPLRTIRTTANTVRDFSGSLFAFAVEKVGGRATAAVLLTASLFTAGIVLGTSTLEQDPPAGAGRINIAAMTDEDRHRAALRADRYGRSSVADAAAQDADAEITAIARAKAAAMAKAEAARKAAAAKKAPAWVLPLSARLTSCFGARWGVQHRGLDIAGPLGAKIVSVGAGTVVSAGWLYSGYGISVLIDHGNGYLTHYAHASKVLVKRGQKVKPGTPVALEGSTGDSTGPHLHFEVHKGLWNHVNPATWLRAKGLKIGC